MREQAHDLRNDWDKHTNPNWCVDVAGWSFVVACFAALFRGLPALGLRNAHAARALKALKGPPPRFDFPGKFRGPLGRAIFG